MHFDACGPHGVGSCHKATLVPEYSWSFPVPCVFHGYAPERKNSPIPIRAIHTPFIKLQDVKVPILLAPRSTGGDGVLTAQVINSGGFAFVPAGDNTVKNRKKEVQDVGIGFLGWYLDARHKDLLVAALDLKVKADCDQANGRYTIIFVVVHSGEQAAAAAELRADVVVAQGIEAGGHGAPYAPPLMVKFSVVQKAIPDNGPLIVAAGGI
ncbi:hypothetical protein K438DRAFT_1989120 [Mycena galopus ATCC 62051]|nr:hypothetical protein K438DRAFT_1989120 [Mycena galopus ATCC 62051]